MVFQNAHIQYSGAEIVTIVHLPASLYTYDTGLRETTNATDARICVWRLQEDDKEEQDGIQEESYSNLSAKDEERTRATYCGPVNQSYNDHLRRNKNAALYNPIE